MTTCIAGNASSGSAVPAVAGAVPPKLSIGLFVYNGERYLAGALGAFLDQTFDDFELILSDNASTDRTDEICRAFAAVDNRIRYHRFAAARRSCARPLADITRVTGRRSCWRRT